jgi:opacity protein-like surface antigen
MSFQTFRIIGVAILLTVGLMPVQSSLAAAPVPHRAVKARSIAQAPGTPTPQQLDRQREAERVLKDGENLRRDIKENEHNNNRDLERQVGEQVTKVRESGSDPQKVREAEAELTRLRQQNNRRNYYYDPFYYPYYYSTPAVIFYPSYGGNDPGYRTPTSPQPIDPNPSSIGQNNNGGGSRQDDSSSTQVLGSVGFKDGSVSPGVGLRWNNIGFEVGGIFNQDSLPRAVNDFSLPNNFFFTDLGVKKLSPQWGADLLGFVDVAPRVSVYGSVGVYFQSQSRIAQSLATSELYKQTDETNVMGAVGGGVTYNPSESVSVGLGYHSLRGVTARVGVSF